MPTPLVNNNLILFAHVALACSLFTPESLAKSVQERVVQLTWEKTLDMQAGLLSMHFTAISIVTDRLNKNIQKILGE